jgi:hypothetical protein
MTLTVPIHGRGEKIAIKDVRIDDSKRWQHRHWISMVSAYRNSPFFDHYEERFAPFYARRYDFLIDWNMALMESVFAILELSPTIRLSDRYLSPAPSDTDLRPKKSKGQDARKEQPYFQVFSDRMDFVGGLSIIDPLFCLSARPVAELLRSYQY